MTGNELRDAYLQYFEGKGHKVMPSFPLVLPEDPTTLFTVAGMQPFAPVFRGEAPAPAPRIATSQKVFREGDLEIVGTIGRYHTFYEMLGNFSFGDYFKREAVAYAWEFVTEVMGLPREDLWLTVYEEDDETAGYWESVAGCSKDRIVRLGKKDNWWPQNAWDGPCGPCSEIYLDRGLAWGCGKPECGPGCDCDRFLEFWNLVFQMYNQDASGRILGNLPHPGIDTGMGLERAASLVMGVASNYETDLMIPVIQQLVNVLRDDADLDVHYTPFGPPSQREDAPESQTQQSNRLRSIADHTRAAAFLVCDGVRPGPDGRGSVLRRLIRRSFGHGYRLGMRSAFLYKCVLGVTRALGQAYPDLIERQPVIESTIRAEEEQFLSTVESGMQLFQRTLDEQELAGHKVVDGNTAFTLATTHGFPLELTRDVAGQYGFEVDMDTYRARMDAFREQSRDPSRVARGLFTPGMSRARNEGGATLFTGYEQAEGEAVVLALVRDGADVERLEAGQEGVAAVDATPFYAESGGQVGDSGTIAWSEGEAVVSNTTRLNDLWLHQVRITSGTLDVGAGVEMRVDVGRRARIRRNHTATHLMHAALHRFVGEHATQAGSLVAPDRLRFDFTQGEPLSRDQIEAVEKQVQEWVDQDIPVVTTERNLDEARGMGAMALFGEKYGETVRVVEVRPAGQDAQRVSLELCGGTHVGSTGVIGPFHVTSETGIGAGLRRIEAVTGPGAVEFFRQRDSALQQSAELLRCGPEDVPSRVARLQQQLRDAEKQRDLLLTQGSQASALDDRTVQVSDVSVIMLRQDGLDADALGKVADQAATKGGNTVVVLAAVRDDRVQFVCKVSSEVVKRGVHAGSLVKALATRTGGGGGGRPDFAKAGGRDIAQVDEALSLAPNLVQQMLDQH